MRHSRQYRGAFRKRCQHDALFSQPSHIDRRRREHGTEARDLLPKRGVADGEYVSEYSAIDGYRAGIVCRQYRHAEQFDLYAHLGKPDTCNLRDLAAVLRLN